MPKKKGGKRFQVPRRTRLPPGARWAQKGQASGDSAGSDKQNPPVAEAVGGGKLWSDDWHGHPERLLATEVVRSRMIKLYEAVKESGGEGAAEAAVAVLELPPATELVRLLAGIQAAEERLLGYGIRTKDQDSAEPLNLTRLPSALFAPEKCGAAPAEGSRDAATLDAIASMLKMALDHARAVVTEQQAQSGAVRATRGARAVTAVDTLKLAEFVPVEEQPSSSSNPFASPGPGTVAAESPGDVKARRLALLRALRPSVSLATPHPRVRFEESEFLKYWERMRQEQAWMKRSSLLHSCTTAERCLEQLAKAVTEHGGVVVAADDAGAETLDYIVHPAALLSPEEAAVDIDDVEFLRAVRRDPDQCLVHWWYYPDSYDCWVPATEVDPPTGEEPVKSSPPVHVHLRFLSDLDLYNEWMNPEDYELDADELAVLRGEKDPGNAAAERQAAAAASIPGDISSPAKSKKSKKRHSSSGESSRESKWRKEESSGKIRLSGSSLYRPGFHGVPALASLQAPSLTVTSVYGNLESSDNGDWISAPYGGVPLNLPVHTVSWFRFDEIHERERNSLPEFFDMSSRSKTPAVYSQWRNFMVATYQQNPAQYLTVTSCRRGLAGDVGAIMRVHAFLEHWGADQFRRHPGRCGPVSASAAAITDHCS